MGQAVATYADNETFMMSPELKMYIPKILQACRDWGLDFYLTVPVFPKDKCHMDELNTPVEHNERLATVPVFNEPFTLLE